MKSLLVIVCLAAVLALYTPAAAETDCSNHPNLADGKTCCEMPEFFSDDVTEKCKEYNVPPPLRPRPHPHPHPHPHPRPHPPHNPCFASCVLNETGIFNSEQKLDEAMLHVYLTDTFTDENEEWISIMEMSFKTCFVRMEEMGAKWAAYKAQKGAATENSPDNMMHPRCPMAAQFLIGCVHMENFQVCPSNLWNDSDNCNAIRDFMKDCKPKFGRKHGSNENAAE